MVRQLTRRGLALVLCLAATSWSGVLFAADGDDVSSISTAASSSQSTPLFQSAAIQPVTFQPVSSTRFALREMPSLPAADSWGRGFATSASTPFEQRWWGPGRWHRNNGARTAVILGSVAAITGAALLVYANRPACGPNHSAAACGYGTKVIGGSLLAGGAVAITVGALSWR